MYENDFCEYAVQRKKEGGYLVKIVVVCVILAALLIGAFVFLIPTLGAIGFAIMALFAALAWYLSRYLSIEYEYTLSGEYMDFAQIFSKQYRKEMLSVELKKCAKAVMPYEGNFDGFNVKEVYDFRSSSAAEHPYVLIFADGETQKAVLFDATKRIVENMFRQVPSLVKRDSNLPE